MAVFCKNGGVLQFFKRNEENGSLTLFREITFNAYYGEPVHGVVYAEGTF